MRKKILSILLAACLIFSLLPVSAMADTIASGTCGDDLTWTLENRVLTISGTGKMENYYPKNNDTTAPWGEYCSSIKSVVIGDGVTNIGDGAFYNCARLTSVTIPNSVTEIGSYAFYNCSVLASIAIPDSVTAINSNAFENCISLTSVVIPDGVTEIGWQAFDDCSSLKSVTIPSSVKKIETFAFANCSKIKDVYYNGDIESWLGIEFVSGGSNPCISGSNLYFNGELVKDVVIPDGITSIGNSAFRYCGSLTSVTIPDSVRSIGGGAFCGCSSLKGVTIPDSVTKIGESAFFGCKSLTSMTIPGSVTSIGSSAFWDCSGLTSVSIGSGVISIGSYAFNGCSSLKSVTIPDGVVIIESYTFSNCGSLTSVTIPNSVKLIEYGAFSSCEKLKDVYYNGDVESWLGIDVTAYDSNPCTNGGNLYYNGVLAADVVIPDGVTGIEPNAFVGCGSLTSVTIPDSVTSIGADAFYNCANLKSAKIGSGVKSIGDYAFSHCKSLTSVAIPDSVTSIGKGAFFRCSSLASVVIPGSITSIGDRVFESCSSLTSVVIPSSVTSIGSDAFSGCGLKSVTIPNSVTSIGEQAFASCSSLTSVVIPSSVTSIGACAFHWCNKLRDIAYGGTKEAWDATGYTPTSNVNVHYNRTTLDGHYVLVERVEPSCYKQGYIKYRCDCGCGYTEDLAALGHNYVDAVEQPTCTSAGYKLKKCSNCGDSYTIESIAALGHNYKNGKCTRCGAADPNYKPAPKAPELKITTSAGKPKIYWNAVDGAAKYWIYRSTDGKNFKYYDSTTKTSYTNNSTSIGSTYYYKIKAIGANGAASDYSVSKGILCKPAAPTVSINRSNGKPKLSWKAVSGATKYWIYRSTDGVNFKYFDSTTKTSYTNSGAASGTKYYYRVKAVAYIDGVNVTSANSSTKSLMTSLAKPSVSITTSNGKPKLTWKAVTGADKYYIYRSTDGKNFSYFDSTTKTTYVNSGAKKNTKYYYKVKAVCASNSNANSAQSAAVSIKATK